MNDFENDRDREREAAIGSLDVDDSLSQYLYNGETFDESLSQQYLRARCYDPTPSPFAELDPFADLDDTAD